MDDSVHFASDPEVELMLTNAGGIQVYVNARVASTHTLLTCHNNICRNDS